MKKDEEEQLKEMFETFIVIITVIFIIGISVGAVIGILI